MIVRRALSVAILGGGLLAWIQAHWESAVSVAGFIAAGWMLAGWLSYSTRNTRDPFPWQPEGLLVRGPLAWVWALVVTPWTEKEDGGPDGF